MDNKNNNVSSLPLYVTANSFDGNGLFSIFSVCVSHIFYAFENGYIPIVDLKHYANQYFKDNRAFKDNVWEYFFKQPAGLGLDDIKENSNVIISKNTIEAGTYFKITEIVEQSLKGVDSSNFEEYFKKINFSDKIKVFLENEYKKITGGEKEVLGIICRGTDYTAFRPNGHYIQPEVKDVIKKAKQLLKRFNYKKIYLATEDENIYEKFMEEFGDILLPNCQHKYFYDGKSKKLLNNADIKRKNHMYSLGKEYLLSIYILSKCKYLIGGKTSALVGLWFISEGFKNQQYTCFFDIGKYCNSNIIRGGKFLNPILSFKNKIKETIIKKIYAKRTTGFNKMY